MVEVIDALLRLEFLSGAEVSPTGAEELGDAGAAAVTYADGLYASSRRARSGSGPTGDTMSRTTTYRGELEGLPYP